MLSSEEWEAWYVLYLEAASALDDREARIAAVAERLEMNFELIGVTAIEDKLQARRALALLSRVAQAMRGKLSASKRRYACEMLRRSGKMDQPPVAWYALAHARRKRIFC